MISFIMNDDNYNRAYIMHNHFIYFKPKIIANKIIDKARTFITLSAKTLVAAY